MIAPPPVVNYFDVRWAEGYGHVSDAAGPLAVAIEQACADVSAHGDDVTLATRQVAADGPARAVGVLRFDVVTSSGPRTLQYVHAVALPAGYALDDAGWRRLVARRYGDDAGARIRVAYEQMALTSREAGHVLLAPFAIEVADVVAALGPAPVAPPPASPPPATRPPTTAPGQKARAAPRSPAPAAPGAPPPPSVEAAPSGATAASLAPAGAALAGDIGGAPVGDRDVGVSRRGERGPIADDVAAAARPGRGLARIAGLVLALAVTAGVAVLITQWATRRPAPTVPPGELAALREQLADVTRLHDAVRAQLVAGAAELEVCRQKLASGAEGQLRQELAAAREEAARVGLERDRARAEASKLAGAVEAAQRDARAVRAAADQAAARAAELDARATTLHDLALRYCRKLGPAKCRVEDVPR